MKIETFEEYLKGVHHASDYAGIDDDMPDDFEDWIAGFEQEEMMAYSDSYGAQCFLSGILRGRSLEREGK